MSMHPVLKRIQHHLARTGQPPTRFGREALGDPRLVGDLRRGREPSVNTVARIDAFIAARENAFIAARENAGIAARDNVGVAAREIGA